MDTKTSALTVADLCDQFKAGNLKVNRNYQRSSAVWPLAAKSYLIDTVLEGYPMPKMAMVQKLDLKARKSVKEIVDGQQRTNAIFEFYSDKFKIGGKSRFSGLSFSKLEDDDQLILPRFG
jgi:hypothetical protein